ncbi:MAG: tetratricopeptide repeat protein [Deltaproteobacteria bacterium]|nr:tetratricopeptide repeat protein [Deltaproteobacteria bacterium]
MIIYLDEPATARLLDNLWRMLEPEGFLFLGYTENLPGLRQIYDRVSSQDYVAYRKPGPSCPARTEWSAAAPEQRPARPTPSAKPVPALAVARPGPEPGKSVAQRCELARQHCLADRHGAAMEAVEGILAQSPQCARARLLKGYLLTGRGERAAAIEECVKVLDVDPLRAEAHLLLGMLLEQAGDAEDAVGEVRKALYLEPGLALAHYTLGKLRAGQGERDEAVRAFAEAIRVLHARPDAAVAAELPVELGPRALMDLAEQHLTRLALGGPVP